MQRAADPGLDDALVAADDLVRRRFIKDRDRGYLGSYGATVTRACAASKPSPGDVVARARALALAIFRAKIGKSWSIQG